MRTISDESWHPDPRPPEMSGGALSFRLTTKKLGHFNGEPPKPIGHPNAASGELLTPKTPSESADFHGLPTIHDSIWRVL